MYIHVFCKHPRKLEIKSDGDISDGAFYHSSCHTDLKPYYRFKIKRALLENSVDFLEVPKRIVPAGKRFFARSVHAIYRGNFSFSEFFTTKDDGFLQNFVTLRAIHKVPF